MADLGLLLPGRVANWGVTLNANFARLNAVGVLKSFAVDAVDKDPVTGLPTSLVFIVAPGWITFTGQVTLEVGDATTLTAPANATTYVWMNDVGDKVMGAALPAGGAYAPLARLVADATRITTIQDIRHPVQLLRAELPLRITRRNVTAADTLQPGDCFLYFASGTPFTFTLTSALTLPGRVIHLAKNGSAAAITVAAYASGPVQEQIGGAPSIVLDTPYQSISLVANEHEADANSDANWTRIGG